MDLLSFDPNIWGTVSDWCMVIVTSLTAFYLYKTLQSQKEVQKTQNNLFEIEKIRFTESIKPKFTFSVPHIDDRVTSVEDNKTIHTVRIKNVGSTTALDLSITIISESENVERLLLQEEGKIYLEADAQKDILLMVKDNTIEPNYILFSLDYKDIYGTSYIQKVFCILYKTWISVNPGLLTIDHLTENQ